MSGFEHGSLRRSRQPAVVSGGPDSLARQHLELDLLERQRQRIAFDLHDGPSQTLSAALLRIGLLESIPHSPALLSEITELKHLVDEALNEIHEMVAELRPASLDGDSLVERLRVHVNDVMLKYGLQTSLVVDGDVTSLTSSAQITIFRIVQEALTNVRRHARAQTADVRVHICDDHIECRIVDDGCGFDIDSIPSDTTEHHGLCFMIERAALLDGVIQISSTPQVGTAVTVRIPRLG